MNRKILLLLIFFLIFLLLPTTSFGRSKNRVSKKTKEFTSSCSCENVISVDGEYSITQPGLYTVTQNIYAHISVQANNVKINLCGNTISYLSDVNNYNSAIEVAPGFKNVAIENGKIDGLDKTKDGIRIKENCSMVSLKGLKIYSCDSGLYFFGAVASEIKDCEVNNCIFKDCNNGVLLYYAKKISFVSCKALNCTYGGFCQDNCKFNIFDKCYALETLNNSISKDAVGFSSFAGQGNLYNECVAEGTTKSGGDYGSNLETRAIGFLLTGTEDAMEKDTKIINSVANTTLVETPSCTAYGILLESVLLSGTNLADDLVASYTYSADASVNSADWSPDGKYLAIVGFDNLLDVSQVEVLMLKTSSLSLIATYSFTGDVYDTVRWSPDGGYLAVALASNINNVKILKFGGSTNLCLMPC